MCWKLASYVRVNFPAQAFVKVALHDRFSIMVHQFLNRRWKNDGVTTDHCANFCINFLSIISFSPWKKFDSVSNFFSDEKSIVGDKRPRSLVSFFLSSASISHAMIKQSNNYRIWKIDRVTGRHFLNHGRLISYWSLKSCSCNRVSFF